MSRSGYCEDLVPWDLIRWRGAVNSAIKGKRGQSLLSEMAKALDSMPVKRLIKGELINCAGEVCSLGAVAKYKCLPIEDLDPDDSENVASRFNIAEALAKEIVYQNDDFYDENPEKRWQRIRKWVAEKLSRG